MKSTREILKTLFGWGLVFLVVFITAVSNVSTQTSLPVSSGLRLWLRSDMGITLDGSGRVQTWADQSGNGNDFTQDTANARPTLIAGAGPGGTDVLHFDGADDVLQNSAQIVTGTSLTVFTVVAVREPGYPWTLGTSLGGGPLDPLNQRFFYEGHPGGDVTGPDFFDVNVDWFNGARATFSGINDTRYKVLTITGTGTIHNVRVFVNGTPSVMTNQGYARDLIISPGNTLGFVHTTPEPYTESDFAEFIVYDRELNQTERELVEAYLISRYRTSCDSLSFSVASGSPFAVGTNPHSVAVGDFNGDGKPDLAIANTSFNSVTVLLGNGSGGFSEASDSPFAVGFTPWSVAVGDFNGDGKLDLTTANNGSSNVTVLLGNGSGHFSPASASPFAVGASPYSVAVGDFNGDGKQDLTTANDNFLLPPRVTVLLGDGSGGFSPATGSPFAVGSSGPRSVAVGDFNGDGKLDLTTANLTSNNVTVLLGDGSGGFTAASGSPFTVGFTPWSVAVSDFNGDDKLDLTTANLNSSNVTVLLGNGSGGFNPATGSPFAVGGAPICVAVADFNGDGKADLTTANYGSNRTTVLVGDGSGGFTPVTGSPFAVGTGPRSVAVGDFNGDGKLDLTTANDTSNNETVLLNTCTSNTAPTISAVGLTRQQGSPSANAIIANLSDLEDLETALTVTINGGANATLNGVTVSGISVNAAGVVTADVIADVTATSASFTLRVTDTFGLFNEATLNVTVNSNTAPTLGNYPDTSVIAGGNTTVTPDAAPTSATSMNLSTTSAFRGAFAGNPMTGVVMVTNAQPAGIYPVTVTAFNSVGVTTTKTFTLTVTNPTHCDFLSFSGASGSPFAVGSHPVSVVVGDFNGDGKQDLTTANNDSNSVTVLLGNGSGGFSPASGSPFAVGLYPVSVVVGDFNSDGKQDLATANVFSDNVTVLLGNGSGGFSPASGSPFAVGTSPHSVAVGDFNADGKLDLATANGNSNNVTVLLGDGSDGFSPATGSPFAVGGLDPASVAVGDFNGDGKLDLTTGNVGSNNVTVLLGNGSGGFSPASGSPFAVGTNPNSIAVGDFNGDGKFDLMTANVDSNNVTLLLGNGSGDFSPASGSPFAVGANPYSVAVADFNGDAKLDLTTANYYSHNTTVLLGDGSGGFNPAAGSPFAVGLYPWSVAVGDFNGDGKQDLTTSNLNNINVTVLLNTCGNSPPAARCKNVTVSAGLNCTANASIDNGSFDPDSGDTITLTQTPPGPYPLGTTSVTLTVTDNHGASSQCTATVTVLAPQLTALGPANVWLGLKNSDDVGTKFDLLAEVLKNGSPVGSGRLDAVPGGSSGFNNAVLRTINLALSAPVDVCSGDTLSIRLSVRIAVAVSGHRSGTARLWFNDAVANSRFGATIGGTTNDYFLLDGFTLSTVAGVGPKKTVDVFVDRAVGGNPFKAFGTWSKTL